METKPALPVQRSSGGQLSNCGASGALSSSLSVLSSPREGRCPNFSDSHQVFMERGFNQCPPAVMSPLAPNNGVVGHMYSSSSSFSNDLHFSSNQPQVKHQRVTPFISQSTSSGSSVLVPHSFDSGVVQSTASSHSNKNNINSWCTDALPDFLDFPAIHNSQLDGSNSVGVTVPSQDLSKPNEWQHWADQLIIDDDALTSDWNELLADANIVGPELKVEVTHLDTFKSLICFLLFLCNDELN